ncbi:hypothetical protein VP01_562g3 [Puccinia sorghi]|uniref:Uncharacterized protein n=1 Tax=Puccinia sorghi TaxID=27349 RepID=A0A0L6UIX8_9BASI|nr:hypothetical protein VP01_562g3 [Puccinia sorghi]
MANNNAHDSFQQAMLKTALETIPQLTEENYSIWKDKMTALLKLQGVLTALNNVNPTIGSRLKNFGWRLKSDSHLLKPQIELVYSMTFCISIPIKKLVDVGIDLPQDILAYLVLFKFLTSMHNLKQQIMHSDKELSVKFVCDHLIQFNNEAQAKTKEPTLSTSEAALFSQKAKTTKSGSNTNSNTSKRCKLGYHNLKQDSNHTSDNCWHLHPEKAPKWWRDAQAQWKANKEKEKGKDNEGYFMCLLTLWVESGDPKAQIILDSGASAHIFNNLRFFDKIELGQFDVIKMGKQFATLPIKDKNHAGELNSKGCEVRASENTFKLMKGDQEVFNGQIKKQPLLKKENFKCKSCIVAKITKQPFKTKSEVAKKPFERIHLDLIGPIKPESSLKHQFILTVVDHHSSYLSGFPLMQKSDMADVMI